MSQRETTTRHHLIMNKLRRTKRVTFEEIANYLQRESKLQGYNFNISIRTFQRDIREIASIYGICIKFDFSEKYYYIDDEFKSEMNERFFEAFDVYNALRVSERNKKYVYLEKRRTQGTEHFYDLLLSIKNRFQISFSYQKFYTDSFNQHTVNPLAVKEFKYRWYLIARDEYDRRVKIYALDRMMGLETSTTHFPEDTDFDLNVMLKHSFGVITPNDAKLQKVVLSFEPFQGKHIKSLPLHETQKILIDNEKELRISLNIYVTHDFKMEILSMGETVKVMEPKSFVKEVKETYTASLEKYL